MKKCLWVLVILVVVSCLAAVAAPARADRAAGSTSAAAKEIPVTSSSPEAVKIFMKGRQLLENVRASEAEELFQKAIALDPKFAQAYAQLGSARPGAGGLKDLEKAASLAQGLGEAERMTIDILLADRRGEEAKVRDLRKKLAEIAPGDWRAQLGLGEQLSFERKWDEAAAASKKATELNPKAGTAYNLLGYAYLNQAKNDQAIEAFRTYASMMPGEPNPQDSLGEALMAAGRFDEAEAAFKKAADISPGFYNAWEGVAMTRFLRGDWAGGRNALDKAKLAAVRPIDKLGTDTILAWSQAAKGNTGEAIATLAGVEKEAKAQEVGVIRALAPLTRARILGASGKPQEALELAATALGSTAKSNLPGAVTNTLRRLALAVQIDAQARLSRGEDAKKTLELIKAEAKTAPFNAEVQSMVHFAEGADALARGDAKAAAGHYSACLETDYYCRWQLVLAQEKAGAKDAAAAERRRLLAANRRDADYLYVRSMLSGKPGA